MDKQFDDVIEEFYALKYEQRSRRAEFIGPDRVFYARPTEEAVKVQMDILRGHLKLLAKTQP